MGQRRRKGEEEPQGPAPRADGPVRLNRYVSQAGIASRRKADELIAEGRVSVNGKVVVDLGTKVEPSDRVEVDGRPVRPQTLLYLLLNKPEDTITTVSDDKGRRTVMTLMGEEALRAGVFPVGRLDRHTTGVLLLTNDGELAHRLMHPRYGAEKLYFVRTRTAVKPDQIDRLRQGIELEDGTAAADQVSYIDESDRTQIAIQIHEGRNRQVRRMLEALGHEIESLERVGYAGLTTENVRRGKWRRLSPHEVNRLRRLVKLKPIVF